MRVREKGCIVERRLWTLRESVVHSRSGRQLDCMKLLDGREDWVARTLDVAQPLVRSGEPSRRVFYCPEASERSSRHMTRQDVGLIGVIDACPFDFPTDLSMKAIGQTVRNQRLMEPCDYVPRQVHGHELARSSPCLRLFVLINTDDQRLGGALPVAR